MINRQCFVDVWVVCVQIMLMVNLLAGTQKRRALNKARLA